MPKFSSEFGLLTGDPLMIEKFNENEIINSLAEVTLQSPNDGLFKNYLAISSIRVNTSHFGGI